MLRIILATFIALVSVSICSGQTIEEYDNSGFAKTNFGDYRGAIIDYTKVIEIDPKYAGAYYNRGVCKGALEDYRGAIGDYTMVIEIDPKHVDAYTQRGASKGKIGDYQGAVSDFNRAIELNHRHAAAYFNRGLVRLLFDKHNACLDLSKAGELGFHQAYDAIRKFCN